MNNIINKTGALLLAVSLFLTPSCKKNFENLNSPPEGATDNTTPEVFNAIISSLPITSGEYSVMNSWLYPITQQGTVAGSAYNFDNARSAVWDNYFQTLANYRLLQSRISGSSDSSAMDNIYAMLKTIMAYKTFKTTNYFGDMPYSKAGYAPLKGSDYYTSTYDQQSDIYAGMLSDLDWAVSHFTTNSNQVSLGSYETFFQGDISMWSKFANSLRLYIAVTMHDKNTALAESVIADAVTKPLLDDGDDVGLWPAKISGLQFQWRQWSFSANCYLRMGSTIWDWMSANDNTDGSGIFDIRAKIFFEPNGSDQWAAYPQNPTTGISEGGSPYNTLRFTNWDTLRTGMSYSPSNLYFEQDLTYIPELILTSAQVHFIKAEVYNRGIGVTANPTTAQTEYNEGIAASLNMWKGIAFNSSVWVVDKPTAAAATTAEITAVQNSTIGAYDLGDATHALSQIYAQLWIDQYRQPWEAWTLLRRTGGLTPMSADNPTYYTSTYGDYQRFIYPDDEPSYNTDAWEAETGGNDVHTRKIWITK